MDTSSGVGCGVPGVGVRDNVRGDCTLPKLCCFEGDGE